MKVEMEIIYACVRGINMVMRKTQLCCPCQDPECWICIAVQNAKRKRTQTSPSVYFNKTFFFFYIMDMNEFLCFQAVDPRLRFGIWSTSHAPNPQFSEQEVSQLWAPQCHAEWPSTPSLARPFVDLTASCVPDRPLNPARFPLWEYPAPRAWRPSPHQSPR